jgi:hypothetical protein
MKRMILAALISTGIPLPASAQAPAMCAARADIVANLQGKFSEAPVAIGLDNGGGVVEVLASPDGGTWTIIVTDTHGVSCLMAAGEYWEATKMTTLLGQKI